MGAFEDGYFADSYDIPHVTKSDRAELAPGFEYYRDPETDAIWDAANNGEDRGLAFLGRLANYQVHRSLREIQAVTEVDGVPVPENYGIKLENEEKYRQKRRGSKEKVQTVMDFERECLEAELELAKLVLAREEREYAEKVSIVLAKKPKARTTRPTTSQTRYISFPSTY